MIKNLNLLCISCQCQVMSSTAASMLATVVVCALSINVGDLAATPMRQINAFPRRSGELKKKARKRFLLGNIRCGETFFLYAGGLSYYNLAPSICVLVLWLFLWGHSGDLQNAHNTGRDKMRVILHLEAVRLLPVLKVAVL